MVAAVESIAKLDDALCGVPFSFAFLGGSVLSLLITDKTVDAIRVTKDVDIMVDVKNRREFHAVGRGRLHCRYGSLCSQRGERHGVEALAKAERVVS